MLALSCKFLGPYSSPFLSSLAPDPYGGQLLVTASGWEAPAFTLHVVFLPWDWMAGGGWLECGVGTAEGMKGLDGDGEYYLDHHLGLGGLW